MLQRILIIVAFTYLYDQNNAKGIAAQIIIIVYTVLSNRIKPYQNNQIKRIDISSGFVQIFSISLFLYLYQNTTNILGIIIILIVSLGNLIFIIYIVVQIVKVNQYSIVKYVIDKNFYNRMDLFKPYRDWFRKRQNAILKWKLLRKNILKIQQISKQSNDNILRDLRN